MENVKKTPLYNRHKLLGAKMAPFAGWYMPVRYSGGLEEHKAVRRKAGIFDVSHMGEIEIKGLSALDIVQMVTTNDASALIDGQAQYSIICNESGGIVDDILTYRIGSDSFMLCVNASNIEKDFAWIKAKARQIRDYADTEIINSSDNYSQLAVQGPEAVNILNRLTDFDLQSIPSFHFKFVTICGVEALFSRTGYTGEDGFEIYLSPENVERVWDAVIDGGKPFGLQPIGLAARDTLRLEMKYSLYGNDLDDSTTPYEADLGWVVKPDGKDFIGKKALLKQRDGGIKRKLACFEILGKGIARQGYDIQIDEKPVGTITSGTISPTLGVGIGMGYIQSDFAGEGQEVDIIVRSKKVKARVVKPPFIKKNN